MGLWSNVLKSVDGFNFATAGVALVKVMDCTRFILS